MLATKSPFGEELRRMYERDFCHGDLKIKNPANTNHIYFLYISKWFNVEICKDLDSISYDS